MKKFICIFSLGFFMGISAFADVLLFKDAAMQPLNVERYYSSYNEPEIRYNKDLSNITSNLMFSLPSVDHFNFYWGLGTYLNFFDGVGADLSAAVSYSFHEETWPQMEIFLLTKYGFSVYFIKSINYYLFASATPYFMIMPAEGHHGVFFGIGPQIEYVQELNYELYNRFSLGASAVVGFRFRKK